MTKKTPIKELDSPECALVTEAELTVEYWRKRYSELFKRFDSFKQLVEEVGASDNTLAGYDGYVILIGINAGRRGLKTTAKVVRIMERLRPDAPKAKPSRQPIFKPSAGMLLVAFLITLASCTSNRQPRTTAADSIYVSAWIGPAKIAVSLKLPADDLDSYRVGQTLPCSPYSTDPDRFSNVFVQDEAGTFPVVIKSLTPIK